MGLSVPHLLVVMVVILVVYGPGRLPDVFRKAGEGVRAFREAQEARPPRRVVEADDPLGEDEEEVVVRRKKRPTP